MLIPLSNHKQFQPVRAAPPFMPLWASYAVMPPGTAGGPTRLVARPESIEAALGRAGARKLRPADVVWQCENTMVLG
jgi:hypothetical protein